MPGLVDPEKARDELRERTDYDPDDPRESALMRRAAVWFLSGVALAAAGIGIADAVVLVGLSVIALGVAVLAVGLDRAIRLLTRR